MSSFSEGGDEPSAAEWAVMVVSVVATLSLFGYVAWHAAVAPTDVPPEVSVTGTQTMEDGRVVVAVEIYNPGSPGLKSVTVSADCSNESLTFTHVPMDARETGNLVCPAGTTEPTVSVQSWIEGQGRGTT